MAPYRNQPRNTNLLQSTQFMLTFPRIPDTTFFCQSVNLPGINLAEVMQNTPLLDIYRPGDKLQYDPLTVTFLVDEWLNSWKNIHDWMRGIAKVTFPEYSKLKAEYGSTVSDGTLTILSGKNNPVMRFLFRNCFPTSLAPIQMSATDDGGTTIAADVTFRYDSFDIIPIHNP